MTNVGFTPGPLPETILDPEPTAAVEALARAETHDDVAAVAARFPRCLEAWARLAELTENDEGRTWAAVEAYAYARVGYHRGLDRLRQSGWRGAGYVRWQHETNRGFLRALDALRRAAVSIGEIEEAARCTEFLHQLDPDTYR